MTRRTATKCQPNSREPRYLPLTVRYAIRSPTRRRGANFPARQVAVIEGKRDSKSGSRRQEPSMNGKRACRRMASRPARLLTSGRYVVRKQRSAIYLLLSNVTVFYSPIRGSEQTGSPFLSVL